MEQHQHLNVSELNKSISFYSPLCCVYVGFTLWCLMNSHIHTLVAFVVDLIMLSTLILLSFSFVDHVVECVFIYFLVQSIIASLP
jgi:hypothetical protein